MLYIDRIYWCCRHERQDEKSRRKENTMKNTAVTFKQAKEKGEKLTMLTAYDYSTAKYLKIGPLEEASKFMCG